MSKTFPAQHVRCALNADCELPKGAKSIRWGFWTFRQWQRTVVDSSLCDKLGAVAIGISRLTLQFICQPFNFFECLLVIARLGMSIENESDLYTDVANVI